MAQPNVKALEVVEGDITKSKTILQRPGNETT